MELRDDQPPDKITPSLDVKRLVALFLPLMKSFVFLSWVFLLLTALACSREKVPAQEMPGYSFTTSPKVTSAEETVGLILGQVNTRQARQAEAASQNSHSELRLADEPGTAVGAHPTDTEFMIVTEEAAFQRMLQAQSVGVPADSAPVDFKREFVVLLIHPPAALAGATFLDDVAAEVEADTTVRLLLSSTALPAAEKAGPGGYGQYNYQVTMYKLPKKAFKQAHVVFAELDDALPLYVPL